MLQPFPWGVLFTEYISNWCKCKCLEKEGLDTNLGLVQYTPVKSCQAVVGLGIGWTQNKREALVDFFFTSSMHLFSELYENKQTKKPHV